SISTPSRIRPGPADLSSSSTAAVACRASRRSFRASSRRTEGFRTPPRSASECKNAPVFRGVFFVWRSPIPVIARSAATKQSISPQAETWIASLTLAMTAERLFRGLLFERRLQAVELRHQRVADRGTFCRWRVDREVEPADPRLQAHRARNQILQLRRQLFDHVLGTGICGRELDLGLFPI